MRRVGSKNGFTLLELLTVIAIIAILAAIMLPVFKSAKDNSKKSACLSKLHDIGSALQQYQLDNHRYPRCLLGYYSAGQPMTSCTSGLYPEYVRNIHDFTCDAGPDNVDDPVDAVPPASSGAGQRQYYVGDSYDWTNTTPTGAPITAYLTTWAQTEADVSLYSPNDNRAETTPFRDFARQMRFKNADTTSVVTWCTRHGGSSDKALVLFLSGTVSLIPLDKMDPNAGRVMWRVMP